ncbi:hypothetical protein AALA58_08680, partial [Lactococcus ileimucosae]
PLPNEDSAPAAFDFSTMRPGRIFTMAGEQYRYLENMGSGNHMIIRNDVITPVAFTHHEVELNTWRQALAPEVQAMIQPVSVPYIGPAILDENIVWEGGWRWIMSASSLAQFPDAAADITRVDPSGTPRAFALSVADVVRLSGPGRAFPNRVGRTALSDNVWWTRTLSSPTPAGHDRGWIVNRRSPDGAGNNVVGWLNSHWYITSRAGMRPALIINQTN